jgi:hypothetical protein
MFVFLLYIYTINQAVLAIIYLVYEKVNFIDF